jgi:hypothetical protein
MLFLITMLAYLPFGCVSGDFELRAKLEDAVQRHALIDERIMDWGEPSGKETLSNGQLSYTWKFPWSEERLLASQTAYQVPHMCTVLVSTSSDNVIQSYKTDDCLESSKRF